MQIVLSWIGIVGITLLAILRSLIPQYRQYPANLTLFMLFGQWIVALSGIIPSFVGGYDKTVCELQMTHPTQQVLTRSFLALQRWRHITTGLRNMHLPGYLLVLGPDDIQFVVGINRHSQLSFSNRPQREDLDMEDAAADSLRLLGLSYDYYGLRDLQYTLLLLTTTTTDHWSCERSFRSSSGHSFLLHMETSLPVRLNRSFIVSNVCFTDGACSGTATSL